MEKEKKELESLINDTINLNNSFPGASKLQRKSDRMVKSLRASLKMSRVDHSNIKIQ